MSEKEFVKPECQLLGKDGNVFVIIGLVSGALRNAGYSDKAKEFTERAISSESYNKVLQLCFEYVVVT